MPTTTTPISLFSFSDLASKNSQDFAAGYHHCLDAVNTFLSSAGSSLDQNTRSQISHQLKTTTDTRAAVAPVPSFKVWQPRDDLSSTKSLPSPALFCVAPPSALLSLPALTSPETQSTPRGRWLIPPQHLLHCLNRGPSLHSPRCRGKLSNCTRMWSHHLQTRTPTGVCYGTKQRWEAGTEPAIS